MPVERAPGRVAIARRAADERHARPVTAPCGLLRDEIRRRAVSLSHARALLRRRDGAHESLRWCYQALPVEAFLGQLMYDDLRCRFAISYEQALASRYADDGRRHGQAVSPAGAAGDQADARVAYLRTITRFYIFLPLGLRRARAMTAAG